MKWTRTAKLRRGCNRLAAQHGKQMIYRIGFLLELSVRQSSGFVEIARRNGICGAEQRPSRLRQMHAPQILRLKIIPFEPRHVIETR
jgi:hypothetical protein